MLGLGHAKGFAAPSTLARVVATRSSNQRLPFLMKPKLFNLALHTCRRCVWQILNSTCLYNIEQVRMQVASACL